MERAHRHAEGARRAARRQTWLGNFERIIDGQLNPKIALMTGRMRLRGDIRIAMRLDKVFGLAPTQM